MSAEATLHTPAGPLVDVAPPPLRFDHATEFMLPFIRVAPGVRAAEPGCGSGMLALYMGRAGAGSVIGTDVDRAALAAARENAVRNSVGNAEFVEGSLLEPIAGALDLVVANLPHRPAPRPFDARYYGGCDGTDLLRAAIAQARERLVRDGRLYLYANSIANPGRVRAALGEAFDVRLCGEKRRYYTEEELDALTPGLYAHIAALAREGTAEIHEDARGTFFFGRVYEGVLR